MAYERSCTPWAAVLGDIWVKAAQWPWHPYSSVLGGEGLPVTQGLPGTLVPSRVVAVLFL